MVVRIHGSAQREAWRLVSGPAIGQRRRWSPSRVGGVANRGQAVFWGAASREVGSGAAAKRPACVAPVMLAGS